MYQCLIHLAILSGARRGELVALQWDNIDLQAGIVMIKQSNYKIKGNEIQTKEPKNKRSIREVSIPQYCCELLRQYKKEQLIEKFRLGDRWQEGGWVFTQWNGEPMNPDTPTQWFTKFLERNGMEHHKFHALRHTSATLLIAGGTNIKTVSARLGHAKTSTTDIYVHAVSEADTAAAEMLGNLLNPVKKNRFA